MAARTILSRKLEAAFKAEWDIVDADLHHKFWMGDAGTYATVEGDVISVLGEEDDTADVLAQLTGVDFRGLSPQVTRAAAARAFGLAATAEDAVAEMREAGMDGSDNDGDDASDPVPARLCKPTSLLLSSLTSPTHNGVLHGAELITALLDKKYLTASAVVCYSGEEPAAATAIVRSAATSTTMPTLHRGN
ncbi:hypothetical protein JCM1840_002151 [Sporobolomyces johnsonii]